MGDNELPREAEQHNAEGEVAVARLLMDSNDFHHSLRHLTDAIALDPRLPDAHEALAEFVARVGGADRALGYLDQLEVQEFIGTVATRAHLCAIAGRWDEAIQRLFNVASYVQHRMWLDVAWLQRADLPKQLSPDNLAAATVQLAIRLDDPVDEDDRDPLLPALNLLRACTEHHSRHATLLWCGSLLARRLGAIDEAISWAERSFAINPSYEAATAKGYALRTAGRMDEALAVWIDESRRTPNDIELHLDIADLLNVMGRPTDGLEWAQRAVAQDPRHHKAIATVHGLRYSVDQDARHLVALVDMVRAQPGDSYAAVVLAQYCQDRPWLGIVPPPEEAMSNALSQVLENQEPSSEPGLNLRMSAVEAPSATLALRTAFPRAEIEIEESPAPDARIPVRPVRHTVWKYTGLYPQPAVSPPPPEVAEAVRSVAEVQWPSPLAAYDQAVSLSGCDPKDLLKVLVHPPRPPGGQIGEILSRYVPQLWLRAVQTWVCLGIAHHQTDSQWSTSRRREILADLLNGPEDWISEAAAFALIVIAWTEPSTRDDIHELMVLRLMAAVETYHSRDVAIIGSLSQLVLLLPQLNSHIAQLAHDVLDSRKSD